jgi:hypothetical protein
MAIEDDFYIMVDFSRPVWFRPSNKGLRFIPEGDNVIDDALIIYGVDKLDFSPEIKKQIKQMKSECIKEQGEECLLEPYLSHKLLMLDARKELKNLTLKSNFLLVTHGGSADYVEMSCKHTGCIAQCAC